MPKNKKTRKKKTAFSGKTHANSAKKLAQFNTQILQLYHQKNIAAALTLSQKALTHFANDATLLRMAAGFSAKLNKIEQAKDYLIHSLKYAKNVLAYYHLGKIYQQTEALDAACECYKKALQLDADHADVHRQLAAIYLEKSQFEDAKIHYHHCIKVQPDHHQLGTLYKQESDIQAAIAYYKNALKLDPKALETHYNLAILQQRQQQYELAEIEYQAVLALDSNHAATYLNLGVLLKEQNRFDEARQCFNRCLELNPNSADTIWNLALFFLTLGEFNVGWKYYESRHYANKTEKSFMGTQKPDIPMPMYRATDTLANKNLLIYFEQGFGDEIQFVRYLPLLKSQKKSKK
ncbi:MAG: tetratricopeptide repeat protein [Gammaproteobacteria bacterium]|nr:tetratricopeptide repeat protein [Gammaproteobacteria bacterium]